jgi:hypothetical protein
MGEKMSEVEIDDLLRDVDIKDDKIEYESAASPSFFPSSSTLKLTIPAMQ